MIVARDVTAELETEQLKSDFRGDGLPRACARRSRRSRASSARSATGSIEETPEARHEYYEIMWRAVERLERLHQRPPRCVPGRGREAGPRVEAVQRDRAAWTGASVTSGVSSPTASSTSSIPPMPSASWRIPSGVDQIVTEPPFSNAFKLLHGRHPRCSSSLGVTGSRAVVAVHNEGDGIAPADQPHVFDRFFRTRTGLQREVRWRGPRPLHLQEARRGDGQPDRSWSPCRRRVHVHVLAPARGDRTWTGARRARDRSRPDLSS